MDKLSLILSGAAVVLNLVVLFLLLLRNRGRRDALTRDQLRAELAEQNRQNALELMRKMHKIDTQNAATKAKIDANLKKALECDDADGGPASTADAGRQCP